MTWEQAIKEFQDYLRIERGLADNSVMNYSLDLQRLRHFLAEHRLKVSPIDIDNTVVQQFIYEVAKEVSATSQSRMISGLKSFFSFLLFENYRTSNPMELIETPRLGRKLPDVLSLEEIDLLISVIDLSTAEGERNRSIIETLYGCGLRVTELVELRISDLYFEEGFISVTGKGNKQRFVPIAGTTQKLISLYINEVRIHAPIKKGFEDILYLNRRGRQLSRAMIFTIVKQLAKKAELEKKISPHTFRHSFATHLLENGADLRAIQLMMGHESITTTEIYMHLDRSHLQEVLLTYHPRKNF